MWSVFAILLTSVQTCSQRYHWIVLWFSRFMLKDICVGIATDWNVFEDVGEIRTDWFFYRWNFHVISERTMTKWCSYWCQIFSWKKSSWRTLMINVISNAKTNCMKLSCNMSALIGQNDDLLRLCLIWSLVIWSIVLFSENVRLIAEWIVNEEYLFAIEWLRWWLLTEIFLEGNQLIEEMSRQSIDLWYDR